MPTGLSSAEQQQELVAKLTDYCLSTSAFTIDEVGQGWLYL